jgi:hypothetical protein
LVGSSSASSESEEDEEVREVLGTMVIDDKEVELEMKSGEREREKAEEENQQLEDSIGSKEGCGERPCICSEEEEEEEEARTVHQMRLKLLGVDYTCLTLDMENAHGKDT